MAITNKEFKQALKLWASGVAVVTTKTEKFGLQGMTVTSFTSVSLDSQQILVCINKDADTGEGIFDGGSFAVNLLSREQETISNQFAGGCSQEERFEQVAWVEGKTGMPIFTESLASLECTVADKIFSGTHWVIIGNVQNVTCAEGEPLLYFNTAYKALA
ncbi:MAG: flavin reductase family protein [Methylococcales bacterium]|nr:flavin reductase family protein [Methylococcales bacterium]MCK5924951.1 flavin reductase family protein [Methylococcales bacterium]